MDTKNKPIWAVELSWGQECYHTHWTKYYTDESKAKDEYRRVLIAQLELGLCGYDDNERIFKRLKKKSDHEIQCKIQELINKHECESNITIYFDLQIYNILDRLE